MRYAIVSDIHSNLEALNSALEIINKMNVNAVFSCGDIIGYGPNPEECINIIKKLSADSVVGNHDYAVNHREEEELFNAYARLAIQWTRKVLTAESQLFIKNLPLFIEHKDFTLFHGSLDKNNPFDYILSLQDASLSFKNIKTQVGFFGHSHIAGYFVKSKENRINYFPCISGCKINLKADEKYLINVGSIGQPRDGNPKGAFAIYDTEKQTVEIIRFTYDIETTYKKIVQIGLPRFLGERLFSGV